MRHGRSLRRGSLRTENDHLRAELIFPSRYLARKDRSLIRQGPDQLSWRSVARITHAIVPSLLTSHIFARAAAMAGMGRMKMMATQTTGISAAERQVREELAACYRIVARYGLSDLIYNHITARVPGSDEHLLINPFGVLYEEISASSLIKIDLAGDVIAPSSVSGLGVNRAGYVIHSAVHGARPDVACVIHTHTRAGCAVAAMQEGLLPLSQTALRFYGRIGYHDFEGPATELAERERLIVNLGSHDALILRHHGLLTCGRTIGEAFHLMQRLDAACQIQVAAMAGHPMLPSAESQTRTSEMLASGARAPGIPASGRIEWAALVRQQDRIDQSYKH